MNGLSRRVVVAELLRERDGLLVVAGLGAPAWDCAAAGDDALNFYLWGGMGSAALVGLGLALAQPSRKVVVVTGDGELLMGLGSLATIAVTGPRNYSIVVLDNERYGETGMQPTHTAFGVDLAGIAAQAGLAWAQTIVDAQELGALASRLKAGNGPGLAAIKVAAEDHPLVLPPRDGAFLKDRFRQALLGSQQEQ